MIIFRKLGSLALRQMAGERANDLLLLVEKGPIPKSGDQERGVG